ncbi:hypothetical protein [Pseudovibrio sp. WM33]|uniref:hypothetical protein n=1 Tax=Pseudovibrio sp. WM33 TaxID=1735585 RepID=UPI0007AE5E95|nr:hypothetical protein [Pseudovibrio sp. WM33]KZL22524.1 hypothetical protein PsWM33_03874 [Pseudovibrio sp. WM33]
MTKKQITKDELSKIYLEKYDNVTNQALEKKFRRKREFDLWSEQGDEALTSKLKAIIKDDRFITVFELYLWNSTDKALSDIHNHIVEFNEDCFCIANPNSDVDLNAIINFWLREPLSNLFTFEFTPDKSIGWYLEKGKLAKIGFRVTNQDLFKLYE